MLTEPVRQDKESDFYRQLHAARSGTLDADGAAFWNGRHKLHLPVGERSPFQDVGTEGLLVLTCTRRERSLVNAEYIRGLKQCCRVNAVVSGPHAQDDNNPNMGMCKSIPLSTVFAIGMQVKLTVNICPGWGLCNGSRGTVVDVIYPGDSGYVPPPSAESSDEPVFPLVIVAFPDYCGTQVLLDDHPTFVPIVAMERRCNAKSKCCFRRGLPLVCCFGTMSAVARPSAHFCRLSSSLACAGVWQG